MVFSKLKVIEGKFYWPIVKPTNFTFKECVKQITLSHECWHIVMCCAVLCYGF